MRRPIEEKIAELKRKRNAVILAHNYQPNEVQVLADFLGDSLGLSRQAADSEADVIVFCGVRFMAETASILAPDKLVLLPDRKSGCPMARMINARQLRKLKAANPDAVVVCYINSTAEVKAESDICCTSANACKVVESIPEDRPVIFVPDKYLGHWVSAQTGRQLILWNGHCQTHAAIVPQQVERVKRAYPDAVVMVHPECIPSVVGMADVVTSTSGMVRYARQCSAKRLIIGTEEGLLHRLRRENPEKEFILASQAAVCPNMKRHATDKILWSLEQLDYEIKVADPVRERALKSIETMLAVGRDERVPAAAPQSD